MKRYTSLSVLEEAATVTFRRTTWLPLDDCLFALQRFIPHLTRSSLHRLYKRNDISQLPIEYWHDYIGAASVADAILDRLLHSSHRLTLRGESMRKSAAPQAAEVDPS